MMISQEIPHQARLFLMAVVTGTGMVLVYDLFRIFRRVVKHETVGIAIEDMLFWISCAFWLFRLMYRENDGSIRGFVILGAFVGMLLYTILFSKWVVRGGTAVFRFIVKVITKIARVLFAPFGFMGRRVGKSAGFLGHICKKRGRRAKKRLKKVWRAVKMGICKL